MVLTRLPNPFRDPVDWRATIVHIPFTVGGPHGAYHTVWHYNIASQPSLPTSSIFCWTETQAREMARQLVAMPMVAAMSCEICRYWEWGPTVPRWNIYRAPNGIVVPPCVLWDINTGVPPGYPPKGAI